MLTVISMSDEERHKYFKHVLRTDLFSSTLGLHTTYSRSASAYCMSMSINSRIPVFNSWYLVIHGKKWRCYLLLLSHVSMVIPTQRQHQLCTLLGGS